MKKYFLFLAGSALILASCGSNNNANQGPTQAQIDSAANAKASEMNAANAAKNDSTLKAIEAEKAAAEAKGSEHKSAEHHSGGKKTETAAPAAPVAPAPAPTVGNGKPKMGAQAAPDASTNSGNTVGNGKPKMGGH